MVIKLYVAEKQSRKTDKYGSESANNFLRVEIMKKNLLDEFFRRSHDVVLINSHAYTIPIMRLRIISPRASLANETTK